MAKQTDWEPKMSWWKGWEGLSEKRAFYTQPLQPSGCPFQKWSSVENGNSALQWWEPANWSNIARQRDLLSEQRSSQFPVWGVRHFSRLAASNSGTRRERSISRDTLGVTTFLPPKIPAKDLWVWEWVENTPLSLCSWCFPSSFDIAEEGRV